MSSRPGGGGGSGGGPGPPDHPANSLGAYGQAAGDRGDGLNAGSRCDGIGNAAAELKRGGKEGVGEALAAVKRAVGGRPACRAALFLPCTQPCPPSHVIAMLTSCSPPAHFFQRSPAGRAAAGRRGQADGRSAGRRVGSRSRGCRRPQHARVRQAWRSRPSRRTQQVGDSIVVARVLHAIHLVELQRRAARGRGGALERMQEQCRAGARPRCSPCGSAAAPAASHAALWTHAHTHTPAAATARQHTPQACRGAVVCGCQTHTPGRARGSSWLSQYRRQSSQSRPPPIPARPWPTAATACGVWTAGRAWWWP